MARRFASVLGVAALGVMALGVLLPATASADDSIYWSREQGTDSIRVGPLTGDNGGATPAQTLFNDGGPCGIAANPAAGKIYWANWFGGGIRVANLDGSGSASSLYPESQQLCGVAVDPAANKIYWADFDDNTIRVGNLDGTGTPLTLFAEPGGSGPSGVAIDPAAGKIYWTNQDAGGTGQVRVGNLSGGTAATLFGFDAAVPIVEDNPIGVAIDPAAGKIYWTDLASGLVRVGPLGGSIVGPAQTLFSGETPSGPAIDPTTNKIYWTSWTSGTLGIRVGPLGGSTVGSAQTLFGQHLLPFGDESAALFAALVKAPVNIGRPEISGGAKTGKELTCQNGTWAPDLLGAFLYRAPRDFSYRWQRGVTEVATTRTYIPTQAGDYTCTVTATNQAGSTSQTSPSKKVKDK